MKNHTSRATLLKRNSELDLQNITQQLISEKIISVNTKSLYVYCSDILENRLNHLAETFPPKSLHAVAIKSNSHRAVLEMIVEQDCGLEAASYEEVVMASMAGCPNEKIVFDSPVKTIQEIEDCNLLFPGMILNANCFQELERLKGKDNLIVGIRINPLTDIGSPGIYNVSSQHSKFGIPITEDKKIVQYALQMSNVKGLHIHAGSEIGSRINHLKAIGSLVELAEKIRVGGKKLDFIDIGGGIPANMEKGPQEGLDDFFKQLVSAYPQILEYRIITEYGRFVQAHTAFVISKVEYVLDHCDPNIALIHVGADLFPREIYSSHPPYHELYVMEKDGTLKMGDKSEYDIGGPLCFSGDFVKKDIALPNIEEGDYICISDTGANTLSMWSRHCGREEVEVKIM